MKDINKPKLGLLPLMLELYKTYSPEIESSQQPFIQEIAGSLGAFSELTCAPVCSTVDEVRKSVREFESGDVDMIVVLFISYATSISALNPLLETSLPLLLFSTAPNSSMAEGMTSDDITLNHGVHGYMDLANVLRRNDRRFSFVSGRKDDNNALRAIETEARAALTRKRLKRSNIGLAGYTFDGMGDFGIDTTWLNARLGPVVKHIPLTELADAIASISDSDTAEESGKDRERFEIESPVDDDILNESNKIYLGLSKLVGDKGLNAVTMHFQGILEHPGIKSPPFLAISKLQEQGIAYAGEGDLLGATANIMLHSLCGDTVFTETFCPDFDGGRIVMGHMGESNPLFGNKTVLRRKNFRFGDTIDPVIADVHMQPGRATVLNLGIVEDNQFQMIVYSGDICDRIPGSDDIDMPYFHFKPDIELPDFLTEYGLAGGTHHIAMSKGDRIEDILSLSEMLGIETVIIG